jgi:DNA-directed RNA polymerase specialized sigma24 family protein
MTHSPPTGPTTDAPHPLLTGTTLTYEDLVALKSIWLRRHPHEIALLIGSLEWIEQQRRIARREKRSYMPIKALRMAYRSLEGMEVERVSSKRDTLYGKEIDSRFLNRLELTLALLRLPSFAQDCWILSTYHEMSYAEMATTLESNEDAVRKATSEAGKRLIEQIFERVVIQLHIG